MPEMTDLDGVVSDLEGAKGKFEKKAKNLQKEAKNLAPKVPDIDSLKTPEAPKIPERSSLKKPKVPNNVNDIQLEGGREEDSLKDKFSNGKNRYCQKELLKFDNIIYQNYETELLKLLKQRELQATKPIVEEIDKRV